MAMRPILSKAVRSEIDWLLVGIVGAMAVLLVLSTTLMASLSGRSGRAIGRASLLDYGQSSASLTRTIEDVRSQAEHGNEGPIPEVAFASYPEGGQQANVPEAAPGSAVEQNGPKQAACQNSLAPDFPSQVGGCERGAAETRIQVTFANDPTDAARLAKKEHKLMFVLHISGNFEESKFT